MIAMKNNILRLIVLLLPLILTTPCYAESGSMHPVKEKPLAANFTLTDLGWKTVSIHLGEVELADEVISEKQLLQFKNRHEYAVNKPRWNCPDRSHYMVVLVI